MTKNQKMLLGLGAVAVVGYLVYQNNKPKGFANAVGKPKPTIFGGISNSTTAKAPRNKPCGKYTGQTIQATWTDANGNPKSGTLYECEGEGKGGIYTTVPPNQQREFAGRKANLFGRRKRRRNQGIYGGDGNTISTPASGYPDGYMGGVTGTMPPQPRGGRSY